MDLLLSFFFSTMGLIYIAQARKQGNNAYFFLAGIGLLGYSYFTTTPTAIVIIGILLMALPYLLQHYFPL